MDISKSIVFPQPLRPGDTIAVTAPSSGVPSHLHSRLDRAITQLEKRGYRVLQGQCLREQHKNKSAEKALRATELMDFLTHREVKAVMPPWGGDLGMELLPLIDFEALRQQPAKWFSGFSDLTTFQFPLTTLSGWATLHGPNLMDLGASHPDEMTAAIWRVLEAERGSVISQVSSSHFQTGENQWGPDDDAGFCLTEPSRWKVLNDTRDEIHFTGRLIGGCLDILSRLAGTAYGQLPRYRGHHRSEGTILYFENVEMGPCELTRALMSLRLQNWFDDLTGILIGRNAGPEAKDKRHQHTMMDALRSVLGDLSIPVIYDVDIGHIPPQLSLVNGATADVYYHKGQGGVRQYL